ncbi:MAG: DNA methyltransferase [bacterium]
MSSISWNEVRDRALKFSRKWAEETSERAEAKTFWDQFFNVFGVERRAVASFEEPVRNLKGKYNYIDLFWKGTVLAEHKSRGKDLDKAGSQAFSYIQDLARDGRMDEIPRYIIVSDFDKIYLHDLDPDDQRDLQLFDQWHVKTTEITLKDLHNHVRAFAFIKGEKAVRLDPEDPANQKATDIMGELHDTLKDGGYEGHNLERFLVRVLFCLFADDTGLFDQPHCFQSYIKNHTREDGSDLGMNLAQVFEILDTHEDKRQKNLDDDLTVFPYVNGGLFQERLPFVHFNRAQREALLACCDFNWSKISPAVFGSLFQSVMEPKERRQSGGHYTSERDIMKVIRSLFLDDLRAEFGLIERDKSTRRNTRLEEFHRKLANLRFFDPACGCGNFLVITYRELRLLEIEVLKELHDIEVPNELHKKTQLVTDIQHLSLLDVDQMYGIEISEWPARIAEVAMWLLDHQMNQLLSEAFGQYYIKLPLRASPHIVSENALRLDWKKVLPPEKCSFILGNPPFVGKHLMDKDQMADMVAVWGDVDGSGILDYVTAWYRKAAEYIKGTDILVGFVSTNSICQGEQVGILWNTLFQRYGLKILFGHRTFTWESEARGKAHVHVVIVGFYNSANPLKMTKRIYEYHKSTDKITVEHVKNISPYLIEGSDLAVMAQTNPICEVPACVYGNKPTDGGHLIIEEEDRESFIRENPDAKKYIKKLLCAEEYLHSVPRWCLWLVGASPADIKNIPGLRKRIEAVKTFRLNSKKVPTQKKASEPTLFAEIRQPKGRYIVIPQHSSESRPYIPFGYFDPDVIIHNSCTAVPDVSLFHFGVMSSAIHMAWVKLVCGRIKSDYRYSNTLVYNNFPWPEKTADKQRSAVEIAAQKVLDARKAFPDSTLADLYDPVAMPPLLAKAHAELDKAVDRCYCLESFPTDRHRVEFLFAMYEKIANPLAIGGKEKKAKKKPKSQTNHS